MKEAILAFLVALVIGAGVNGFLAIAPPPPAQQEDSAAKADEAAAQADLHNVSVTGDQTFDRDVLKSDIPVLVDFYGEKCPPCKMMAPVIGKLANQYIGKVKFYRVEVGEDPNPNPSLTSRYNITSIPTFILFSKGQRGESFTGLVAQEMLTASIDKSLQ